MTGLSALWAKITASKALLAATIAGSVIVVGGVAAGAYYGVVVPNQPENVLKSSVKNLTQEDQISGTGKATFTGKEGPAVTAEYSLQSDRAKQATAGTVKLSISGVSLPLEFRLMDKSAYLKVGNLDTIKSLAAAFGGAEAGAAVDQIASKVSNKWIEFDESLLKTTVGNECDPFTQMSDDEINQIMTIYESNSFVTIKSTSDDTVDGQNVSKYDLAIDQNTAKQFGEALKQSDTYKRLQKCGGNTDDSAQAVEDFKGNVEFSVWVDKGTKEVKKIGLKVSDDEGSLDADFVFNNEPVNIEKPEGAVPAMQLISELGPLLGGGGGASTPSTFPGLMN